MNKLLTYNPEPFTDLDPEAEDYEIDALAGEWETEDAEEEGGKPGRSRMSRISPRRYLKKPTVRPRIQGRATGARVKPFGQPPKFVPRPLSVPAFRPVPIPFVPPLWGLRPDLEPAPPRDIQRPDESRRPEQAGPEGSGSPPTAQPSEEPASEHVRWVQDCLNRALGLQLPVDGVMNRETRSAVRAFQERQGLAITGLVGPDTEATLKSACAEVPSQANETAPLPAEDGGTPHPAACTCPSCCGRAAGDYEFTPDPKPFYGNMEFDAFEPTGMEEFNVRQRKLPTVRSRPTFAPPAPAYPPRVITFSEVKDDRISVPAQYSLVRLSRNPSTSATAVGLLEEVKAGRLGGISCVNWQKHAAKRAERLGKTWWTAIPKGEDAVLMLDPDNLASGPPLIAFRRELDPRNEGCGRLKNDTVLTPSPGRLDAALIRAWNVYSRFRRRDIVPCDGASGAVVSPTGEPTVPETCRIAAPPSIPPWVQDCLNRVLATKLRASGVLDVQTRSALRTFRQRYLAFDGEFQNAGTVQELDAITARALAEQCKNDTSYCRLGSGGRQLAFQHMWNLIICHYYHGLPTLCKLRQCTGGRDLREVFSPELIIAIFWEETRFRNMRQKTNKPHVFGPATGFGQVEDGPRRLGCDWCGIRPPWGREDILQDDIKSVQITGMVLWRFFCASQARTEAEKKTHALRGYAGWFAKSGDFKGDLKQWRQCREIIIRGWLGCETELKERPSDLVRKDQIVRALSRTRNTQVRSDGSCTPTLTYNESAHGNTLFPDGNLSLLDLSYTCKCTVTD